MSMLGLSLALSIFLTLHSTVVNIDYDACFENYASSINGMHPYNMVGEMSFRELTLAMMNRFSASDLFVAAIGLLALLPFSVAWLTSKDEQSGILWVILTFIEVILIIFITTTYRLKDFYDCDLNGISLGIVVIPMLCAIFNILIVFVSAVVHFIASLTPRY